MPTFQRLGRLLLLVLMAGVLPPRCQQLWAQVEFLDERQPIPESALFDAAQYEASGVPQAFAADKRQIYDLRQYGQAAARFGQLLGQYPYKAAIWVYLARAYFHSKELELSRQTLARAGESLPDLREGFWKPLEGSMEQEVRRQAEELKAQVEFYPERMADFAPLLRLYRFLHDTTGAQGVVRMALERRAGLYQEAEVATGAQRLSYLGAAGRWEGLAESLNRELDSTAAALLGDAALADSLKQAEVLRLLQLRVDFYLAKPQEYQQLFGEYLRLGRRSEAAAVVAALKREIQRLEMLASIAPNAADEDKQRKGAAVLENLRQQLEAQLGALPNPQQP